MVTNEEAVAVFLDQLGCDVNARVNYGWTALNHIVNNNKDQTVVLACLLVQSKIDVNAKKRGKTDLHCAIDWG